MSFYQAISRVHRRLGRSVIFVRVLLRFHNQCQSILRYFFNEGCLPHENGEEAVLKAFAPTSGTFIDVGANVGAWTESFLVHAPKACRALIADPSLSALEVLRRKFSADSRCELKAAALSDREGEAQFFEEPSAGETSSLVPGFSRRDSTVRSVTLTTLDREVERLAWERVGFLKVDAEGHDLQVLQGAQGLLARGAIDVIQFEYNAPWKLAGSRLEQAVELLEENGYRIYLIKAAGLVHLTSAQWLDYYDYSNYLAVGPGIPVPSCLRVFELRFAFW